MVRKQAPYCLIGSPACRAFCTWQRLNIAKSNKRVAVRRAEIAAIEHINFVVSLYFEQLAAGRYFVHEHPRWATSSNLRSMMELQAVEGVRFTQGDQCRYGAEVKSGPRSGDPIMKPTGNSPQIIKAMSLRCTGRSGECSRPGGGRHHLGFVWSKLLRAGPAP